MAEHVDTLDFFGRLENRLALVATMTEAQGQRLDRLALADPVAGELCNELGALRTDVAAVVDELRKLARHVMAVEAVVLPAVALAQQLEADRRKVPGIGAVNSRHAGRWDQPGWPADNVVPDRRRPPLDPRGDPDAQRMEVARQLLELRRQGRLVDARALVDPGLATFGLLDLVEQLANGLANVANAPALAQLADVIRRQIRTLADTDARAAQTPVYMVLGPAYPQSDKALEGIAG